MTGETGRGSVVRQQEQGFGSRSLQPGPWPQATVKLQPRARHKEAVCCSGDAPAWEHGQSLTSESLRSKAETKCNKWMERKVKGWEVPPVQGNDAGVMLLPLVPDALGAIL